MLAILTTHPVQYQAPLWQALAKDGRVPFEVWYLTDHGVQPTRDREFGNTFSWDIDTLSGYPHRFLETAPGATPASFWKCRLKERLWQRLRDRNVKALWIQGWQVAAYWQAVREAKAAGIEVWLRGESNDLAPVPAWKRPLKRLQLGWLFKRVDRFFYIGSANKRLYRRYGVPEERLHPAPYAVDNDRFSRQAALLRAQRAALRRQWGIAESAFCILFCGKLIPKKRPMDLVAAARRLRKAGRMPDVHLLFAGSGELGAELRRGCRVVFDAEGQTNRAGECDTGGHASGRLPATFAGFLNQSEISRAYVAADCLVLPSDYGETWGLVVNEALASGLPCIVSDACGCAEDLGRLAGCSTFPAGDVESLADQLEQQSAAPQSPETLMEAVRESHSFDRTVQSILRRQADAA